MPENIIVIGANGRMGKTIIELAQNEPDFKLVGAVDLPDHLNNISGLPCIVSDSLEKVLEASPGIIIDFTSPSATLKNLRTATRFNAPVVTGTTGFDESQKRELESLATKIPVLWSANMSIGVNVLLKILPELAKALGPAYDMEIVEIHHGKKKDAPSGTALMLGNAMASARDWSLEEAGNFCRNGITGPRPVKEIGIQALRGGDVVGIHKCYYFGPGEILEVSHQAESRENFAQGALRAAKWLSNKPCGKLYSMQDVLFS